MAERGIDAYVTLMADFQTEREGEHFKAIRFVTGRFSVCMRLWLSRIRLVYGPMADTFYQVLTECEGSASIELMMFVDDTQELEWVAQVPDGGKWLELYRWAMAYEEAFAGRNVEIGLRTGSSREKFGKTDQGLSKSQHGS